MDAKELHVKQRISALAAAMRADQPPPPRDGTLSGAQFQALIKFRARLGQTKFNAYRAGLGLADVGITRMSKAEAWRLINRIVTDLETEAAQ